jgi:hypothetical protein
MHRLTGRASREERTPLPILALAVVQSGVTTQRSTQEVQLPAKVLASFAQPEVSLQAGLLDRAQRTVLSQRQKHRDFAAGQQSSLDSPVSARERQGNLNWAVRTT